MLTIYRDDYLDADVRIAGDSEDLRKLKNLIEETLDTNISQRIKFYRDDDHSYLITVEQEH